MTHATNVIPFRKPESPELPPVTTLSFVHDYWVRPPNRKRGKSFRVFWAVSPSGDYLADCEAGQQMALEWFRFCGNRNLGPVLLGWIVQDMPRDLTGLEVNFLSTIGLLGGSNPYAEQIIRLREEENKRIRKELG